MWTELILDLSPATVLKAPASPEAVIAITAGRFGVPMPTDIIDLLLESDGAESEWGGGVVWSAGEIVRINATFRAEKHTTYHWYDSFDDLLFFGAAGNGDQFAFVADGSVLRWDHETDDRQSFASDLRLLPATAAHRSGVVVIASLVNRPSGLLPSTLEPPDSPVQ